MEVELFGNFVDVAPVALGSSQVAIIDQRDVQLSIVFCGEKLVLIAQRGEKVAVAVNVRIEPLKLATSAPSASLYFGLNART